MTRTNMNVSREINCTFHFINWKKWDTVKKTFHDPIFDCGNSAGYVVRWVYIDGHIVDRHFVVCH
jgi:hypothetical protein